MLCWVQECLLNSNKFRREIFNNTGSRKLVGTIKTTITMSISERIWHNSWVSSLILFQSWFDFSVLLSYAAGFYFTCSKIFMFVEKKNSVCIVLKDVFMAFKCEQLCNCSLVVNRGYLYSHCHVLPCLFSSRFHFCPVCRKWMGFSRTCSQSGSAQDSSTWNGSHGNPRVKSSRKLVSKCWSLGRALGEEVMECLGLQSSSALKTLLFWATGKV